MSYTFDPIKVIFSVNTIIHKLFPYLKHRFETIHACMDGPSYNVNNGPFVAGATPSTVAMVTTDRQGTDDSVKQR